MLLLFFLSHFLLIPIPRSYDIGLCKSFQFSVHFFLEVGHTCVQSSETGLESTLAFLSAFHVFLRSQYSLLVSFLFFLLFFCYRGRALPFGSLQNTNDVMTKSWDWNTSIVTFILSFFSSFHEHYSLYDRPLHNCHSKDTMRDKSDCYVLLPSYGFRFCLYFDTSLYDDGPACILHVRIASDFFDFSIFSLLLLLLLILCTYGIMNDTG